MKVGDIVKLLPNAEIQARKVMQDYVVIWEEPYTFENPPTHPLPFFFNDVGTILSTREIVEGYGSSITHHTWIQILCSTGFGWIKRSEVVQV